ncbi:hypothetical protein BH753_gp176 [Bacillus phage Shbh1]|uniref:Uncharacterized protein n=1 Tax=Bacillus phage Shbh1 TaxID=1796992 RepID=A0A142F1K1_9CAUD|nr:hypothetical protein BH753_gp176 [Bacillus phage Shbh1]AMQ66658.1 hypothetical protein [Bacillus phage Shbh1]
MSKDNFVKRSMARGAEARGTSAIPDSGRDAYSQARKSLKGHYRVAFTRTYERMTEKDIELRSTYGKDLISAYVGVPTDMITLKKKRTTTDHVTLTSLDEVYYVKVGKDTYGKLSVRTQRLWKNNLLIFVYQEKKVAPKPPQKAFSRKVGFKKKTTSQKSQSSRKSYNSRRKGRY